ncbi:class D sortase [Cytobacillus gottheilii]|uniref:class D sortase n=1 Tax=Cytobacillus gottheilii TaxID=859144 RepID=UPI00214772D4|nr:class D sortase [Cytobacillus gottheilii]
MQKRGGIPGETMRNVRKVRYIVGLVFLLAGAVLLLLPQYEKMAFQAKQEKLITAFEQLGDWETAVLADGELEQEEEGEYVIAQDAKGVLSIPAIELEMLLFDGVNVDALNNGAGIIEPEKKMGVQNVAIAGHRGATYGKQFNRLNELKVQDELHVKMGQEDYTFIVDEIFVVDQKQVDVLSDKESPYLTLVTCTPIGEENPTDRLIVQGKLVNGEEI